MTIEGIVNDMLRFLESRGELKGSSPVRRGAVGNTGYAVRWPPTRLPVGQVAYTLGSRQSRYGGTAKTHLQNLATAAAGNLLRIIAWLNDVSRAATPKSHFALLAD